MQQEQRQELGQEAARPQPGWPPVADWQRPEPQAAAARRDDGAAAGPALAKQQGQGPEAPPAARRQWTQDDVIREAGRVTVGRNKAHEFLATWRIENATGTLDLTDRPDLFEWRGYLANHPDRALLWQGGRVLHKFKISRLTCARDNNTHDSRVDFMLQLTDDTVVRLHPGSKTEAKPVVTSRTAVRQLCDQGTHDGAAPAPPRGQAEAPAGGRGRSTKGNRAGKGKGKGKGDHAQRALAAQQGQAERRTHFQGISVADMVTSRAVKEFLTLRLQVVQAGGTSFALNVTDPVRVEGWKTPRFLWYLWMAHERALTQHVPDIMEVWFVLAAGKPGVWFVKDDGSEHLVTFADRGVEVESDPGALQQAVDWEA